MTYKIVRFFAGSRPKRTIERGLTYEEAKEHCNNPETNSRTCTRSDRKRITKLYGPWFDGMEQER